MLSSELKIFETGYFIKGLKVAAIVYISPSKAEVFTLANFLALAMSLLDSSENFVNEERLRSP
jgi:hypothetical protein